MPFWNGSFSSRRSFKSEVGVNEVMGDFKTRCKKKIYKEKKLEEATYNVNEL